MITRSRQVALVLTALLAAGAACQARQQEPPRPPDPAPSAADTGEVVNLGRALVPGE